VLNWPRIDGGLRGLSRGYLQLHPGCCDEGSGEEPTALPGTSSHLETPAGLVMSGQGASGSEGPGPARPGATDQPFPSSVQLQQPEMTCIHSTSGLPTWILEWCPFRCGASVFSRSRQVCNRTDVCRRLIFGPSRIQHPGYAGGSCQGWDEGPGSSLSRDSGLVRGRGGKA
jgi:hypothetical protein